jgi:hypothetical protein
VKKQAAYGRNRAGKWNKKSIIGYLHKSVESIVLLESSNTKQESNNISGNKIMKSVFNRVQDAIKNGSTITYLSSSVDRVFRSMERQALHMEIFVKSIKKETRR